MISVATNYLEMCKEIAPVLPSHCPREWQIWYIKDRIQKREFAAILGYPVDATWPSLLTIDGENGEYTSLFQIYRMEEIITMIPDAIIERFGVEVSDESKSPWIKSLLAINTWLARWLSPALEQPVGALFMDMTVEEMWLSFLVFERYRMVWDVGTKKWYAK